MKRAAVGSRQSAVGGEEAGFVLKPYEVHVSGFGAHFYAAASPGKARAAAWLDYSEARGTSFKAFLSLSSVRRIDPPERFGEAITVGGAPAFFVSGGHHSHYVRFVRPGSPDIRYSHPADVRFANDPPTADPRLPGDGGAR